ncbi:DUF6676 family protein [Rhodococcus sp. HNM0569]|uniref:Rv1476 family membrane protein n=1 Tax=Rhodococcus sp. HNM0569 TaxID=2716340 RepID=UPI001981EA96|nr:DUF6676 family protein [Rhodococcus sp. HNM0569]
MSVSHLPVLSDGVLVPGDVASLAAAPVAHLQPVRTDLPDDADPDEIVADVERDGLSAPGSDADETEELHEVVDLAAEHGIDLKIVVLGENADKDSELRDLATDVGAHEGGTVLVLSPNQVGTFSDSVSRVALEAGQDHAYNGDPVVASKGFVDELVGHSNPWTPLTLVVLVVMVAAVVGVVVAKVRRASPADGPGRSGETEERASAVGTGSESPRIS